MKTSFRTSYPSAKPNRWGAVQSCYESKRDSCYSHHVAVNPVSIPSQPLNPQRLDGANPTCAATLILSPAADRNRGAARHPLATARPPTSAAIASPRLQGHRPTSDL